MKRKFARIATAVGLALLIAACALPLGAANAGSVATVALADDFSGSTIDSSKWLLAGADAQKVNAVETSGALVMKPVQGYSHSIYHNGFTFEAGKSYDISFEVSMKTSGEAWCGIILGGEEVGSTYAKRSQSGIIISANGQKGWVNNYRLGQIIDGETGNVPGLVSNGVAMPFKISVTYENEEYKGAIYAGETLEKVCDLSVFGVAGHLCIQANGDGSTVKFMNLSIRDTAADKVVATEKFEKPTEELIGMTDERILPWIAQNEQYSSGMGYAAKFAEVSSAVMAAKFEVQEGQGSLNLFDLSFGVGLSNIPEGYGFGVRTGMDGSGAGGDFLAFTPAEEGFDLVIAREGEDAAIVKEGLSVSDGAVVRLIGRYNGDLQVYVDGVLAGTARNAALSGYLGFAAEKLEETATGSVSAFLYSAELTLYTFQKPTAGAIGNNFDAMKNGSTTAGYVDSKKWVAEGNCSVRNGVLKFSSGDVNTSFNTKEKYQDFILRFDVTRIVGSFYRDEDGLYATPGYYADMSIGISVGKQNYDESSIGGTHPSVQFCTKYWNKNTEGKITPSMIIWGYGATTASGGEAEWPSECWWHDGSDGKVVTGTDGLKVNIVVIVKNRTISIYYKYSNQDASYLDQPKAVFTNVNTYGYVGISCGYNSTFDIDNLSITPLSFENYA